MARKWWEKSENKKGKAWCKYYECECMGEEFEREKMERENKESEAEKSSSVSDDECREVVGEKMWKKEKKTERTTTECK